MLNIEYEYNKHIFANISKIKRIRFICIKKSYLELSEYISRSKL